MRRPVDWIGSSRRDLLEFPVKARKEVGHALLDAQEGEKSPKAKPLQGFHGSGVLEIVENHDGDTYRAVYTVRFEESVYVLHCFQKKSRKGITTPKTEIDVIERRLREAEERHREWKEKR